MLLEQSAQMLWAIRRLPQTTCIVETSFYDGKKMPLVDPCTLQQIMSMFKFKQTTVLRSMNAKSSIGLI